MNKVVFLLISLLVKREVRWEDSFSSPTVALSLVLASELHDPDGCLTAWSRIGQYSCGKPVLLTQFTLLSIIWTSMNQHWLPTAWLGFCCCSWVKARDQPRYLNMWMDRQVAATSTSDFPPLCLGRLVCHGWSANVPQNFREGLLSVGQLRIWTL